MKDARRPGRNAPCRCGSGFKYKKCCLEADTEAARVERSQRGAVPSLWPSDGGLDEDPAGDAWFGYRQDHGPNPFFEDQPPVCMLFHPSDEELDDINREQNTSFPSGAWLLSSGAHEATRIHGPFSNHEDAFRFAAEQLGVKRWSSPPRFFGALDQ